MEKQLMGTATTYRVTGMTCAHCVSAVQAELSALEGVDEVVVDLQARGISKVRVTSAQPLSNEDVATALDEAGDYHLAPPEEAL
jgi:copper chaperone CopZ